METYSYHADESVPDFDDANPIVFMDGECALCTGAARLIVRLDTKEEFRICPVQSRLGRAVMTHYGLNPDDPLTWLYLEDGRAHGALEGIIRAASRLGWPARVICVFGVLPAPARNWLYNLIAKHRYRFFGEAKMCEAPDAKLRARLIE